MRSKKPQPALTATQFAKRKFLDQRNNGVAIVNGALVALADGAIGPLLDPAPTIALANMALEDDDPRKMTVETVRILREIAEKIKDVRSNWEAKLFLDDVADMLASYLPSP